MAINFTTLATSALGFTVALAWNDAVSRSLRSLFPPQTEKSAARHTIVYALVTTIIVVVAVSAANRVRRLIYGRGGDGCGCAFQGLSPIVRLWEPPRSGKASR
jgi:hypothetical protein